MASRVQYIDPEMWNVSEVLGAGWMNLAKKGVKDHLCIDLGGPEVIAFFDKAGGTMISLWNLERAQAITSVDIDLGIYIRDLDEDDVMAVMKAIKTIRSDYFTRLPGASLAFAIALRERMPGAELALLGTYNEDVNGKFHALRAILVDPENDDDRWDANGRHAQRDLAQEPSYVGVEVGFSVSEAELYLESVSEDDIQMAREFIEFFDGKADFFPVKQELAPAV